MKRQAYNPILPSYEYIPDGEPHVFGDRVYLYGSHDFFRGYVYCMGDYMCYSAPVNDLTDWRCEGVIYRKEQDPNNRDGKMALFAPDVVQGPDGRFYLYYIPNQVSIVSVAVCDTPAGQYEFYGFVHYEDGSLLGEKDGDEPQFDPGVFREGNAIYLYTGFCMPDDKSRTGAMATVLSEDMLTIVRAPQTIAPSKPYASGSSYEGHEFFEAPSMRKRGEQYYFIYSSVHNRELCYATGKNPLGPFTYGGVILDNGDIGIGSYKSASQLMALHCNNHGSFTEIADKWYLFYHRPTNGNQFSRQACAEEIHFTEDGQIPQVEMTSCGLNSGPLLCDRAYGAYIACNLFNVKDPESLDERNRPVISQDGNDGDELPGYICNMTDGGSAGFKYFACKGITQIELVARGYMDGCFELRTSLHGEVYASVPIHETNGWETFSAPCHIPDGVHALYLTHNGSRTATLLSFRLF